MYTKAALIQTKALIEKGWTQGTKARNLSGKSVPTYSEEATCFCIVGALDRGCQNQPAGTYVKSREKIIACLPEGYGTIVEWNDTPGRTKEEVLSVLDQAIALCE